MSRTGAVPSAAGPRGPSFRLYGELRRPVELNASELRRRWPVREAEVTFDCASAGLRRHVFEGVLLRDVVACAEPVHDLRGRRERTRYVLSVSGVDGHQAVLSWAEIDADFGDVPVLLATRLDGCELDASGVQLVVPTDRCGARYVSAVRAIWLGRPSPAGVQGREPAAR